MDPFVVGNWSGKRVGKSVGQSILEAPPRFQGSAPLECRSAPRMTELARLDGTHGITFPRSSGKTFDTLPRT